MKPADVRYVNLARQFQSLRGPILEAVERVLSSGVYILGEEVEKFESEFANVCGTRFAIGVGNGSDAILLSLIANGIGSGDEVITVPNSFVASTWTIVAAKAKPVFVDVQDDFNIDPKLIEQAITPRTKAILPVHLTGRPAQMEQILDIAKRHKLVVIEDAAQAAGAKLLSKPVGSFGDVGCFSLHPLKTLNACGDAGVITTNNKKLYETLITLRNHGLKTRDECVCWGYNSRMDPLQAAIVRVKLELLEEWNRRIREIAQIYRSELSELVIVPKERPEEYSVYHTFVIRTEQRDQLREFLQQGGISTNIHYPNPIHLQECSRELGYQRGSFPVTERQSREILSLPIYPELTKEEVERVIGRIRNFFMK